MPSETQTRLQKIFELMAERDGALDEAWSIPDRRERGKRMRVIRKFYKSALGHLGVDLTPPQYFHQNDYLNQLRKHGTWVFIYLLNGVRLKGKIQGFDNISIIIEAQERQQIVYKHAILPIRPQKRRKGIIRVRTLWEKSENNGGQPL